MMNNLTAYSLFLCLSLLSGCATFSTQHPPIEADRVTRVIVGSAEHPDPILQKVLELKEAGLLSKVRVRESFPVQIELTGSIEVVQALESLSRVQSFNDCF